MMKAVFYLILMSLAPVFIAAQAGPSAKKCGMIYSEEEEALVYKDTAAQYNEEIIIESIPSFAGEPIPVYINPNVQGQHTFKKHPSLSLPEYYSVVIKDTVTGNSFDLKSSDSYTFSVNRVTPDRFVLYIDKKKNSLTASR
jgi:hypothetical protein